MNPYGSLTKDEVEYIKSTNKCPDCSVGVLAEGPSGGGSINFICTNVDCGSRFNYSLNLERISDRSPNRKSK